MTFAVGLLVGLVIAIAAILVSLQMLRDAQAHLDQAQTHLDDALELLETARVLHKRTASA